MRDEEEVITERGAITRIYVENFVTYEKAEILPKANLNMIIGPNGTGKSTIVCAIVLGLGGKPNLVGRGSLVSQYIRNGCQSAKIEIDLRDTATKTITIVRNFNTRNQTNWLINGKPTQAKDVQRLIRTLNIQVDNLCQFLPQDKVQDFSKMNPEQLLENTERSVGDPRLLEYHEQLKEDRKHARDIDKTIANKMTLLGLETQKYEGMKETVGNIKEKKIIKKKITTLMQKSAWISYDLSRNELSKAKVERDKAAAEMKKLDEQLKPIDETIKKLETRVKDLEKTVQQHNSDLSGKTLQAQKILEEIQNKEREVREVEKNREHSIKNEENRDQEIVAVEQQKNKLDNDLRVIIEDVGTEESLVAAQLKVTQALEQTRRVADKLINKKNATRYEEEKINDQIQTINNDMKAAKDVEAKRLELLRMRNHDAYQGVLWLRQNRDKFVATIHEPMLLSIDIKNAKYSKYFESIISIRDLFAFVCEDKSDMNRLLQFLRDQQKLQINAVHSDPNREIRMLPNIPIDHIRQYGFEHYLIDLLEAPDTVMKYVAGTYHIQNIPVGRPTVEDNVDHVPDGLRLFFSQDNAFSVNVSKYSGAKSTRSNAINGNGMLSIILDTAKLRSFAENLESLNIKKSETAEAMRAIEVEMQKSNRELDALRLGKQQIQRNIQTIQSLKTRINMAERKIRDLQNDRTSIEDIKATATHEIRNLLKKQMLLYARYNAQYSNCYKFVTTNEESKLELDYRKRVLRTKKNESQDLRDKCSLADETYRRIECGLAPLRSATQKLYREAMESTEQISPSDKQFKPFHTAFAKLPFTIEEINQELDSARAKVYCLGRNTDAKQILESYEKAKANVHKLNEEIEVLRIKDLAIAEKIDKIRVLWLTMLQELVDRINTNFSTYFSLMGCAGEVTLKSGHCINDFDEYGLKIKVKFRDTDELQELTRQRQSGGERALTTAVYMIALQELSRVPFRCVDEINQGMDSVNERRVFELIVKITGKSNGCQYFLLTPKLLPDLEYGENVTVHCVHNGPYMLPSSEFDIAKLCARLASR